ncbi:MAG: PH domain-containing protein [Alphaproteobacteria bacterium]|nr:PH domain-containing protein [Alphaproteobacteria bacterium]
MHYDAPGMNPRQPFVAASLIEGEQVQSSASYHWIAVATAILRLALWGVVAAALWWLTEKIFMVLDRPLWAISPWLVLHALWLAPAALGTIEFARRLIEHFTIEIAVTNQRLLIKQGWISRHTQEIRLSRIEEVNLRQGVLGRILGYASLRVAGVGAGEILLEPLARPLIFRDALAKAKAAAAGSGVAPPAAA